MFCEKLPQFISLLIEREREDETEQKNISFNYNDVDDGNTTHNNNNFHIINVSRKATFLMFALRFVLLLFLETFLFVVLFFLLPNFEFVPHNVDHGFKSTINMPILRDIEVPN